LIERTATALNDSDRLTCRFSRISRAVRPFVRLVLLRRRPLPCEAETCVVKAVASFFRTHEILISWRLRKGAVHDVEFNRSLKLWNRRSSALQTAVAVSLLAGPGV